MNEDNKKSKLINTIIRILTVVIFLPLLTPLILLCLVCLCLPLLFCFLIVYLMYCHGILATLPWLTWPISIWLIALGLFGSGQMICDTFYRGN